MAVKPAFDTLRDIRDGRFLDELAVAVNDLVRQVRATDKSGELTIKLAFNPVEKDAARGIIVHDEIRARPPKPRRSTLFFVTPESNLSRRDPRQPDLPGLRDASRDEPSREVSYHEEDVKDLSSQSTTVEHHSV